ncbi:16S rRNA (guanine(966)-N(2))-methyltransferase RsmD [Candidatus Marinamargulisbacteria bacterium SCGC AG-410-N11]|nr:16S rRNA (guanine(966)-N(2))-methyltransferase RsmD [Candidatus Marinamargulisbacteria bacterium SCGC AG-410-N11]
MFITAGEFKGTSLLYPASKAFVRPTKAKVRQAVFNILQNRICGSDFLDLFCGTGVMGLEALSRGASFVQFVDKHTKYVQLNINRIMKHNIELAYSISKMNVVDYLKHTHNQYDIVLLDPPWLKVSLFVDTLKALIEFDILKKSSLVICEHPSDFQFEEVEGFTSSRIYKYGRTNLTIFEV